jgi:hypothetical protein
MMALSLPFRTTKDAANALAAEAQASSGRVFLLPYNRFDKIDDTSWWLCHRSENPAYKFGKIICTKLHFGTEMFIGFYVEKGLDPTVAGSGSTAKEKRYRMDESWLWHEFLDGLKSGEVDRVASKVERLCERPVVVALDGGVAGEEPEFERFTYSAGKLTLQPSGTATKRLSAIAGATTLGDVGRLIETSIPDLGWVWIDFHIGQTFDEDGEEEWQADAVWSRACSLWASWVFR